MRKAGIYVRISQDRAKTELGVQRQEEDCRKLAQELDLEVAEVYSDNDLSASKRNIKRPDYDRMWADVQSGRIDTVLAYHPDRLYRRLKFLEDLIDVVEPIAKAGRRIDIQTVSGEIELRSATGRLTARIFAGLAQYEAEHTGERVSRSKAEDIKAGIHTGGGRRAYGYTKAADGKRGVVPEEAAIVREIVDRVLDGEVLNRVALSLNERGVLNSNGGRWVPSRIKRMLLGEESRNGARRKRTSPLIAGMVGVPALISADELVLLRQRFASTSKRSAGRRYILTGLLVCSKCKTKLSGTGGYYRCSHRDGGCGATAVKARAIEALLEDRVEQQREHGFAHDPAQAKPLGGDPEQRAALIAELADFDADVDRLSEQSIKARTETARIVTERALDKLEERRVAVQEKLNTLVPPESEKRFSWSDLLDPELEAQDSEAFRRFEAGELTETEMLDWHDLFAAYFETVTVEPQEGRAKTLDPSRIKVEWAYGPEDVR